MTAVIMVLAAAFGGLRIYKGLQEDDITIYQLFLAAVAVVLALTATDSKRIDPMPLILVAFSVTTHN